eukprot:gene19666-31316_t
MLNLDHSKMTKANASGTDDSKLDWRRIPSSDGFCTCVPDPAGLPDFYGAYSNATYLGRARFRIGTGGLPDGKPLVMDHYSVGGGWRANPGKELKRPEGCINPQKSKDCPAVFPWSPDRLKTPAPKPSAAQ